MSNAATSVHPSGAGRESAAEVEFARLDSTVAVEAGGKRRAMLPESRLPELVLPP